MRRCWVSACAGAVLVCGVFAAPSARAQEQTQEATPAAGVAAQLQLVPQPREVKETGGEAFRVTQRTRIVVDEKFGRDFQGAEMLAEEIDRWTGWKLKISDAREMPGGADFIYIGDATKDSKLRESLGTGGLAMQQGFDAEGYAILADHRRILVGGASEAGAFYGAQTLRQLLRPANGNDANTRAGSSPPSAAKAAAAGFGMTAKEKSADHAELECPAVAIRDWPAMKWRGVSIDISRGPIPTLKFMEEQIRTLASYKVNLYALYMEDVFTVKGNQIFAPPDALTPDEIKELVAFAQKYYVTIVPELETFGHLHNILRYDLYSDLAEVPHGSVLTPTQPGTYDLLEKLISEMAPLFPGPFFHIGADETFELGQGKTKELIAQQGLGPVYLAHIAKLDEMLKPFHKQTMFWADIAEKFPQLLPTLPKDLIAVIWTYAPKPSYDNDLKPFQDAGLPIFVSPGVHDWRHVFPDLNDAYMNIRNLTRDGQKYGAEGMLNTDWKDMGETLSGMAWPGFVFGAAAAWQPGETSIEQFRDSYDWAFYRNTDHTFEGILDNLEATNVLLAAVKLDATHVNYFWADPFSTVGTQYADMAAPVVHQMRVDAENAWEALLENRGKAKLHGESLDELIFAAQRLDTMGMKFEYTQEMSAAYWDAYMNMGKRSQVLDDLEVISSINGDVEDLRDKLNELRSEYAQCWRSENTESWLPNVLVRYDALENALQEKINIVDALEDSFPDTKVLPPPETLGFYYRPPEPVTSGK
jgi:hexosaminidase